MTFDYSMEALECSSTCLKDLQNCFPWNLLESNLYEPLHMSRKYYLLDYSNPSNQLLYYDILEFKHLYVALS